MSANAKWPAGLTPDLRHILGFMCFELGGPAHVYRAAGEFVDANGDPLKSRAEDEQAFMLHKLVGFLLEHGEHWPAVAQADLNRAKRRAAEKRAPADAPAGAQSPLEAPEKETARG